MAMANNTIEYDDDMYLVKVRAQVMTRDDSSGGWIPLGNGGLSSVSVTKRLPDSEDQYLIHGKRLFDHSLVLCCAIKSDFEYNKVMPTFHHWRTGDKKFGLTFQSAADARAFDKGVYIAIADLTDGLSPSSKRKLEIAEEEVFMALDLPVERDSLSSSGSGSVSGAAGIGGQSSHLHRMCFGAYQSGSGYASGSGAGSSSFGGPSLLNHRGFSVEREALEFHPHPSSESSHPFLPPPPFSYINLAREHAHEYNYPNVPNVMEKKYSPSELSNSTSLGGGYSSSSGNKKPLQLDPLSLQPPPLLPTKSTGCPKKKRTCGKKRRCRDCQYVYSEDCNPRGSCGLGPDKIRDGIDYISCMGCARGMIYHCVSKEDGEREIPSNPCSLGKPKCIRRWIALGCLSIILPCMCLYIPLAGCHKAAKLCHICGARHHPS